MLEDGVEREVEREAVEVMEMGVGLEVGTGVQEVHEV